MDVLDFPYHQHTTNRWGPVASMDLNHMTTECHAHYQLAQVSDFEAASASSPTLQANGLEGESKVSVVIPSSPGLGYSDTDLLHQTHACLAYATLQSTAHRYVWHHARERVQGTQVPSHVGVAIYSRPGEGRCP